MSRRRKQKSPQDRLASLVKACVRTGKPERIAPVIATSAELAMLLRDPAK